MPLSPIGALILTNPEEARRRIVAALEDAGGVRDRAAKALGASRTTMYWWLRKLNIADYKVEGQRRLRRRGHSAADAHDSIEGSQALAQMVAELIRTRTVDVQQRCVDDMAAVMKEVMESIAVGIRLARSDKDAPSPAARPRRPRLESAALKKLGSKTG